jgi:hypothetical protein
LKLFLRAGRLRWPTGTASTNYLTDGLIVGNVNFDGAGGNTFWIGN